MSKPKLLLTGVGFAYKLLLGFLCIRSLITYWEMFGIDPESRGGGTQILFGRGCAAEASKPVPIFKGHFGGKGYPLLGIFSQENDVFVYFSDKMGENI